jgi:hypothetical protein
MPKFPRFTSGTFGRLDFATMNDLFDRVEQLESSILSGRGNKQLPETDVLLVRARTLIDESAGIQHWSWEEAIVDPSDAIQGVGNRAYTGVAFDDNILVGKNLVEDQTYFAKALYDQTGRLFYRAFEAGSGSGDLFFPAEITAVTPREPHSDGKVYRFFYNFREMEYASGSTPPAIINWRVRDGGINNGFLLAVNTLERDGFLGVGGSAPNIEESPTHIRVGTIVLMGRLANTPPFYYFSAGPATNVRCL